MVQCMDPVASSTQEHRTVHKILKLYSSVLYSHPAAACREEDERKEDGTEKIANPKRTEKDRGLESYPSIAGLLTCLIK